jgi:transcription factor SFP1
MYSNEKANSYIPSSPYLPINGLIFLISQCRNYTCCNLQLNDLHALLQHFEEVHIVVLDPTSTQPQAQIQIPFNPTVHNTKKPYLDDSDNMELDIDLGTHPHSHPFSSSRQSSVQSSPSPPDTPISTPLSNYSSPHPFIPNHLPPSHLHYHHHHNSHSPHISQPPSPLSTTYDPTASSTRQNSPTSTPNYHLNLNLNLTSHGFPHTTPTTNLPNPKEAFNPYARFASDYSSSMPGALFNGATLDEASALHGTTAWQVQQQQMQEGCVPPTLLFSSPAHKHQGQNHKNNLIKALSTTSLHRHHQHHQNSSSTSSSSSQPTSPSSATATSHPHSLSRPGSLLLCKSFRCPKPNCNKSYKQANGLKYHMTHGSCKFAPPTDLERVKDLLERKRRERGGMSAETENGSGLTRSTCLGSAPAPSVTTPSTPTTSGLPSPLSNSHNSTPSTTPPPPSEPSPQPSPPLLKQNSRLSPSAILTYSDLSKISEHDLREVEREAERRLRPYACSVGECQRRLVGFDFFSKRIFFN